MISAEKRASSMNHMPTSIATFSALIRLSSGVRQFSKDESQSWSSAAAWRGQHTTSSTRPRTRRLRRIVRIRCARSVPGFL
jgi:hypothetical protein